MTLDLENRELVRLLPRLRPYARGLLERAGVHALRLHADSVTPEHLLSTLMDDPDSAAHAAVLHAFADPATISGEALAISPGLMVVASASTLPFSPRAAEALARARAASLRANSLQIATGEVAIGDLLAQAERSLDQKTRDSLREAGLDTLPTPPSEDPPPPMGPSLFRHFSVAAKRALSAANRLAAGERAAAISPAHLLLGCLMEDSGSASAVGLSFHRARAVLAGRTTDESSPHLRSLPPDPGLLGFLGGLPPGSDSLALLARFLSDETPELAGILARSKVTAVFLERARGAFQDPEAMQDPSPPRR